MLRIKLNKITIMKNIHLLPTDKPSRLLYSKVTTENKIAYKLILKSELSKCNDGLLSGQRNIYITSDEEIKKGEPVIYDFGMGCELENPCDPDNLKSSRRSKIILTTDTQLIEQGIQAIDDDFLEWFVKNPSCEEVDVESKDFYYSEEYWYTHYKIVIPKDEPDSYTSKQLLELFEQKQLKTIYYEK